MALTLNGSTGLSGIVGSAGTPALQGTDTNTGYFFGTDILGLSTGGTSRLYITSDGKVGIGTTSPVSKLQVTGSVHVTAPADSLATDALQFSFSSPEGHIKVKNTSGAPASNLAFHTTDASGNTNRVLHLRYDGKVGIGTTSPANELVISKAGSAANCKLEIAQSGGGGGTSEILFSDAVSGRGRIFYDHGSNPEGIKLEAAGTQTLIATTTGRVGIGTIAPGHKLHIQDGTTPRLVVEDTTNNVQAQIAADNTEARIGTASNHPISFRINDVQKALLDTSGQFALGRTNQITANGNSSTSVFEQLSNSNYPLALHSAQTNKRGLAIFYATTGAGNAGDPFIVCTDNTDNKFQVTSDGTTTIRGNIVIATAGKGIDFSAQTASSATGATTSDETLDHYEEGSWTPVLRHYSGSWQNATLDTAGTLTKAHYTRVGRMVTATFDWSGFQINSGTLAYAEIVGLPFQTNSAGIGVSSFASCLSAEQDQGLWVASTNTTIQFYRNYNNWNNWISVANSRLQVGVQYQCS